MVLVQVSKPMRRVVFLSLLGLLASSAVSISELDTFEAKSARFAGKLEKWSEENRAQDAITAYESLLREYRRLPQELKVKHRTTMAVNLYFLATAYSQVGKLDHAMMRLTQAQDIYPLDAPTMSTIETLAKLHGRADFALLIERMKRDQSKTLLLQSAPGYERYSGKDVPAFSTSRTHESLQSLRERYKLDEVAGQGTVEEKALRLMRWMHKKVRHNGNNPWPAVRTAEAILPQCEKDGLELNCRMLSTVLNDCYLAMGFDSRIVQCSPLDPYDQDCHVINAVWVADTKRWIWLDPTNEAWFVDKKGRLLSIPEVRQAIRAGTDLKLGQDLNWNGEPVTKTYYMEYMAKNLYWFSVPVENRVGYENDETEIRTYVQLVPKGSAYPSKAGWTEFRNDSGITIRSFTTSDDAWFWSPPAKN